MAEPHEFPRDEYFAIAPGYYDRVYRRGRGVQWFWHERRFAMVEAFLPSGLRRILDLGCGPGTFLGRLATPPEYALGIDLAGRQIEYAREVYSRPGLEFRVADVREVTVGEKFDAVVSIEVIEHLPPADMAGFLCTIHALLEPGGRLVLTTPNVRSLWPLIERVVSRIGPVDYRVQHINPLHASRLAAALAEAGFDAIETATFFVVSPFLAMLSKRLAQRVLALERRLLPTWGNELVACARKPPPP